MDGQRRPEKNGLNHTDRKSRTTSLGRDRKCRGALSPDRLAGQSIRHGGATVNAYRGGEGLLQSGMRVTRAHFGIRGEGFQIVICGHGPALKISLTVSLYIVIYNAMRYILVYITKQSWGPGPIEICACLLLWNEVRNEKNVQSEVDGFAFPGHALCPSCSGVLCGRWKS